MKFFSKNLESLARPTSGHPLTFYIDLCKFDITVNDDYSVVSGLSEARIEMQVVVI